MSGPFPMYPAPYSATPQGGFCKLKAGPITSISLSMCEGAVRNAG